MKQNLAAIALILVTLMACKVFQPNTPDDKPEPVEKK